jgi:hypothetical protein
VPAPRPARVAGAGPAADTSLRDDAEAERFHGRQGQELPRHQETTKEGGVSKVDDNPRAGRACPVREAWTSGAFRRLTRHEHAATAEAARERLQPRPEICARRKGLGSPAWHAGWAHRALLPRGLAMGRGECSLSGLGYHLRRLQLVSVPAVLRGEVVPKTAVQGAGLEGGLGAPEQPRAPARHARLAQPRVRKAEARHWCSVAAVFSKHGRPPEVRAPLRGRFLISHSL